MWDQLILGVIVGTLALFAPGFFVARGLRFNAVVSLAVAPLITLVGYAFLTLAYERVGIACSLESVVLPSVIAGVVLFVLLRRVAPAMGATPLTSRIRDVYVAEKKITHFDAICAASAVAFMAIVAVYTYVSVIGSPESFLQEFDNVHHMSAIRNFAESGVWAPVSTSFYAGAESMPLVQDEGGFYPAAWIMIAALIMDTVGSQPALAIHAANIVFIVFVYPLAMISFLRLVFRDKPLVLLCAVVCIPALAVFPWRLLLFGPLYPNLAAYTMVPVVAALFMGCIAAGAKRSERIMLGVVTAAGVLALVLTQPNAVFTVAVLLVPYCVYCSVKATDKLGYVGVKRQKVRFLAGTGFVAFSIVVWIAALNVPFFEDVISFWWEAYASPGQAIFDILTLSFSLDKPQIVLACILFIGIAVTLVQRRYIWLVFAFGIFCSMFFIDIATDSVLKRWLTGFWYTDKVRIAAAAGIAAVPLVSIGLYSLCVGVYHLVQNLLIKKEILGPSLVTMLTVVFILLISYFPSARFMSEVDSQTTFGNLRACFQVSYPDSATKIYDTSEQAFVDQVKQTVPKDAMVLNLAPDGSVFAYAQDNLNLYYRYTDVDEENERPESKIIRERLSSYATDEQVVDAVAKTGAQYVLLLDVKTNSIASPFIYGYEEEEWRGLVGINDDTSGFEVVLADGDCRLYRIVE